jgi:hypothetical protein
MSPRAPCGSGYCCYLCCLLLCCCLSLAPLYNQLSCSKVHPIASPNSSQLIGRTYGHLKVCRPTHTKSQRDPPKVSSGLVSIFRNDGSSPPAFPPLRSSAHLPSRRSQLLSCFRRVIEHPHRCGHGIYFGHVMTETKCMSLR